MGAYSTYQNTHGFILNEERIRKIHEILTNRGQSINHDCKPKYKVIRSDSFVFETDNVQDILSEDNSKGQKIESISIEMSFEEELSLALIFASETKLYISGENRDFVFLIFSDLKGYLQNEVNAIGITRFQEIFSTKSLAAFVALIFLGWTVILVPLRERKIEEYQKQYDKSVAEWQSERDKKIQAEIIKTNKAANQALGTKNINEKLDFLIRDRIQTSQRSIATYPDYKFPKPTFFEQTYFPLILIFIVSALFGLVRFIMSKFYEKDLFLTGKEVERYSKITELRDKIVWSIVVAFIIGILSSIAVLFLPITSSPTKVKTAPQSQTQPNINKYNY